MGAVQTVLRFARTLWARLRVHRSVSFHSAAGRARRKGILSSTLRQWHSPKQPRSQQPSDRMRVKTILNSIQRYPGFVYGTTRFEEWPAGRVLLIDVQPHGRNRPSCPSCGRRGPHYDTTGLRQFEFVPGMSAGMPC